MTGIDLSNTNLTDVPTDIPSNAKTLILAENKITVLHKYAFVNLTQLETLDLKMNKIETIVAGAFSGLVKLRKLDLSNNNLTIFPDNSTLSDLPLLKHLYIGVNKFKYIDTTQLGVLRNLIHVRLTCINPKQIAPFPDLPELHKINIGDNMLVTFSSEILPKLSGLKAILFGENKFSSLPNLGGVEANITRLDLRRNYFQHMPDLHKYTSLVKLDLSENYITLVPEESLSHIQSGTVNLMGNPVICVSELCWLVSGSWPFQVKLTCPDGTPVSNVSQVFICEGKALQRRLSSFWLHVDLVASGTRHSKFPQWFMLETNAIIDIKGCCMVRCLHTLSVVNGSGHIISQLNVMRTELLHVNYTLSFSNHDMVLKLEKSCLYVCSVLYMLMVCHYHCLYRVTRYTGEQVRVQYQLTHWGQDKIAAISQTSCSNAFSWMKIFAFQIKFHSNMFLVV